MSSTVAIPPPPSQNRPNIDLSVLICGVPDRLQTLSVLLGELTKQEELLDDELHGRVEILAHIDNRRRTIGDKRNDLVRGAKGRYVSFVDDDDSVAPDYLKSILTVIVNGNDADTPDCITYLVRYRNLKDGFETNVEYGKDLVHNSVPWPNFTRKPNHKMCFERDLARSVAFIPSNFGEDTDWAEKIAPKIKREVRIPEVLYLYEDGRGRAEYGDHHFAVEYGNEDHGFRDVSGIARRAFMGGEVDGVCQIPRGTNFNALFGDPLPNIRKVLRVQNGVDCIELKESEPSLAHWYQSSGHASFLRFVEDADGGLLVYNIATGLRWGAWEQFADVRRKILSDANSDSTLPYRCLMEGIGFDSPAPEEGLDVMLLHFFHEKIFVWPSTSETETDLSDLGDAEEKNDRCVTAKLTVVARASDIAGHPAAEDPRQFFISLE